MNICIPAGTVTARVTRRIDNILVQFLDGDRNQIDNAFISHEQAKGLYIHDSLNDGHDMSPRCFNKWVTGTL